MMGRERAAWPVASVQCLYFFVSNERKAADGFEST